MRGYQAGTGPIQLIGTRPGTNDSFLSPQHGADPKGAPSKTKSKTKQHIFPQVLVEHVGVDQKVCDTWDDHWLENHEIMTTEHLVVASEK